MNHSARGLIINLLSKICSNKCKKRTSCIEEKKSRINLNFRFRLLNLFFSFLNHLKKTEKSALINTIIEITASALYLYCDPDCN